MTAPPKWAHQAEDLAASWAMRGAAITYEPRCGKTRVAIETAEDLYAAAKIGAAVVVAPNGVHLEWSREQLPVYWRDLVGAPLLFEWRSGRADTAKFQRAADAALVDGRFLWVVANVEALSGGTAKKPKRLEAYLKRVAKRGPALLVVDESHGAKDPSASRTKALLRLSEWFAYRRILTGTPVAQGPFDLWSQYSLLDPTVLGTSFPAFRARYGVFARNRPTPCPRCDWPAEHPLRYRGKAKFMVCVSCSHVFPLPRGVFNQVVDYRDLDELRARIAPLTFHRKKADCLDLPERLFVRRYFELPPTHRRVYDDLRDRFLTQLDDGAEVTAAMALTNLLRLQQVARGHVKPDDGPERGLGGPYPAVEATVELVRENPGKTIVWCEHTFDVDLLAERLREEGVRTLVCDGRTAADERPGMRRDFNDPASDARVWLGTLSTGGVGVDLGGANLMVNYGHAYSLIKRTQGLERNYGSSQKAARVDVVDLVAADTVDLRALDALERKEDLAASLAIDPRARLREFLS